MDGAPYKVIGEHMLSKEATSVTCGSSPQDATFCIHSSVSEVVSLALLVLQSTCMSSLEKELLLCEQS